MGSEHEMLDDRSKRQRRDIREDTDQENRAEEQGHEQRTVSRFTLIRRDHDDPGEVVEAGSGSEWWVSLSWHRRLVAT